MYFMVKSMEHFKPRVIQILFDIFFPVSVLESVKGGCRSQNIAPTTNWLSMRLAGLVIGRQTAEGMNEGIDPSKQDQDE
jgi:hypothetical protein